MEDKKGNVYVWFNNSQHELEENKDYTITGTIKKHDDYQSVDLNYLNPVHLFYNNK